MNCHSLVYSSAVVIGRSSSSLVFRLSSYTWVEVPDADILNLIVFSILKILYHNIQCTIIYGKNRLVMIVLTMYKIELIILGKIFWSKFMGWLCFNGFWYNSGRRSSIMIINVPKRVPWPQFMFSWSLCVDIRNTICHNNPIGIRNYYNST